MTNLYGPLKKLFLQLLILISFSFNGCRNSSFAGGEIFSDYNLTIPDNTLILPDTLREISGLTIIDNKTVACVQDENGILFIYNIHKNKIRDQYVFNMDGDYEGITRVDEIIYVLRSDGTLFEISDYNKPTFKLNVYPTSIPAENNEGLCYDEKNNRLLIASKSKPGKGPEFKSRREIYGFDLKQKKLSAEPVFIFDVEAIKQFALDNNLDLPEREKKQGKDKEPVPVMKFFTSAIALHPVTNELFLLSAVDHMLFIFDQKGNIKNIALLDAKMFNKPEGISFFLNGDMLITNEAQDKKPTLLRFNYHHEKP